MFTYLDPSVRERLIAAGHLLRIDSEGRQIAVDAASGQGSISILGPIPLPLAMGGRHYEAQWYACVRNTELSKIQEVADHLLAENAQASFASLASSMAVNSVLVIGDPDKWSNPLVRVHSSCLTGDVFGSERCECGPQLHSAVDLISADEQGGIVVYMSGHEGRGIGFGRKPRRTCCRMAARIPTRRIVRSVCPTTHVISATLHRCLNFSAVKGRSAC